MAFRVPDLRSKLGLESDERDLCSCDSISNLLRNGRRRETGKCVNHSLSGSIKVPRACRNRITFWGRKAVKFWTRLLNLKWKVCQTTNDTFSRPVSVQSERILVLTTEYNADGHRMRIKVPVFTSLKARASRTSLRLSQRVQIEIYMEPAGISCMRLGAITLK